MNEASPNLDILRSLAVSFVVSSHLLLDNSILYIGKYHVQTLGTLGVMIFFVHTCLVLMMSLAREEKFGMHRPLAFSFLLRRAFRIYPLSITVVVILGLVEHFFSANHQTLRTLLSNIFLVQNLTGSPSITPVLWSLPFECQMYLFLPALYTRVVASGNRAWRWVTALWCSSIAIVLAVWELHVDVYLIKFFPCFLPGILAFCLLHARRTWSPARLFSYVLFVMLLYPTLVGYGCSATILAWIFCMVLGAVIPLCADVTNKWLQHCGKVVARYSYGIYLTHVPVMFVSFHYFSGISVLARWISFLVGLSGLSFLAYHAIEKPGIEFGKALVGRLNGSRGRSAHQV